MTLNTKITSVDRKMKKQKLRDMYLICRKDGYVLNGIEQLTPPKWSCPSSMNGVALFAHPSDADVFRNKFALEHGFDEEVLSCLNFKIMTLKKYCKRFNLEIKNVELLLEQSNVEDSMTTDLPINLETLKEGVALARPKPEPNYDPSPEWEIVNAGPVAPMSLEQKVMAAKLSAALSTNPTLSDM